MLRDSKQGKLKKKLKFIASCFATSAAILAIAFCAEILSNTKNAEAAGFNMDSCLNGYSAKGISVQGNEVMSIRNACYDCGTYGGLARGVLWINDSSTDPNGNVIRIDSWDEDVKQAIIWGGVYSCTQALGNDNWAYHVWFGLPNQMKGNGTSISQMEGAADFFDLSQGYYGDSIYRAVFRGRTASTPYTWSDFNVSPATSVTHGYELPNNAAFYPKKFREAAMKNGSCEDITEGGVTKLKCKMNISVNRCYDNGFGKYFNSANSRGGKCYGDPSELILIAPPYTETVSSGFSSKSRVSSGSQSSESPSWGQNATDLIVTADDDGEALVKFSHRLQYTNPSASGNYNNAFTNWTITITDGSGGTWTNTYSTPGGASAESGWLPEFGGIPTEIDVKVKAGDTVCSKISYPKTVQWDNNDPKNATLDTTTEGSTQACVKVTSTPTESVGYIEFWSRSHVESVPGGDVPYYKASTYDNINNTPKYDGDEVELNLSTDGSSAGAIFSHDLNYVINLNSGITINSPNDTISYANMCTKWQIQSNETSGNGKNGEFCANAYYTGSELNVDKPSTSHIINNINGAINHEFPASEKITFTKKKIPIYRSEIKTNRCYTTPETYTCSYNPQRWNYYSNAGSGSGTGSSKATIIYEPPPVPGGEGPSSGSQTNSNPFYAGETGTMSWNTDVWPTKTRRVGEYQTVAFVSQVDRALGDGSSTHQSTSSHSSSDPCIFWSNQLSPLRDLDEDGSGDCKRVTADPKLQGKFGNGAMFNNTLRDYDHVTVSFSANASMAIPDWIGDKYCTSIGYRWHYWQRVFHKEPKPGRWEWEEYGTPYWTHYSAACRTIAKKPSVAFWNGGLFVGQGDVRTIISTRRQNPGVAVPAASLDPRQYGSWSEYLANVNGKVTDSILIGAVPGAGGLLSTYNLLFSSGATYAWNGAGNGNTALENSPLTIQNSGTLGYSGVEANSAVLERLEAYFKKAAELKPGGCSVLNGEKDINETKICYVNGSVAITGNITLNEDTKGSIYQIPQVVIFATGNINISEKVTQIDAWLISKGGKVDTCTDGSSSVFKTGETQARVDKSSNPINAPGYNTCQDKLIINGPVFAQSVTTKRSFGSDGVANTDSDPANAADTRAVPAEVFNLSAASYLWAYAQAGRYGSSYTEAYSRELPPRY